MEINVIASGSSGNCYCIKHNNKYIFIDVGVSASKIKNELGNIDRNSQVILFVTHEHTDHISGLKSMVKNFSPTIFTSEKTADILVNKGADIDKLYVLDADYEYDMDDFSVTPYNLMHDAVEPFGYKFNFGDNIISFATDLGIISDYIAKSIEGSDTIILESNYEESILKKNSYPSYLKSRILSNRGHLSNKEAHKFIGEMSNRGLKRCFLGHISENSNDYSLLDKYAKTCNDYYNVDTTVIHQKKSTILNI